VKPNLAAYGIDALAAARHFAETRLGSGASPLINELLCDARAWHKRSVNEIAGWIETEPLAMAAIWELTEAAVRLDAQSLTEGEFLEHFNSPDILQKMVYLALDLGEETLDLPRAWVVERRSPADALAFLQLVLRWAQRFAAWPGNDLRGLQRILYQSSFAAVVAARPARQASEPQLLLDPGAGLSEEYLLDLLGWLGLPVVAPDSAAPHKLSEQLSLQLGLRAGRRLAKQQRLEFRQAGGTANSLFIVRAIGAVDGYDVRGTLGPDLGLIIDISDKEISVAASAYLEAHVLRVLNEQTELQAELHEGSLRLRWYDTRLDAGDLGRIIHEALKSQFVLHTISVNLIFDPLRIGSLRPAILAYREERDNQLRRRSEENSPLILCTSCRGYMPAAFCIASAERPPCCGRSYDELATLAQLGLSTEQLVIDRGSTTDRQRGAYLGVDKLAQRLSSGLVRRVNLHSLREHPHPTTAIPESIAYFIDELDAFNVVSRDYTGRTPDGKTFSTLLQRVAGKQVPGFLGVSEAYILSPRFLVAEGGIARVAWMNSSLKTRLKIRSEQIATEKECINLAGLKQHLAAWRK
jgi:hypothetical protein